MGEKAGVFPPSAEKSETAPARHIGGLFHVVVVIEETLVVIGVAAPFRRFWTGIAKGLVKKGSPKSELLLLKVPYGRGLTKEVLVGKKPEHLCNLQAMAFESYGCLKTNLLNAGCGVFDRTGGAEKGAIERRIGDLLHSQA